MGVSYVSNGLTLLMVIAKEKFDYDFFLWCNLRLKSGFDER